MDEYLKTCAVIDWQQPAVLAQAKTLSMGLDNELEIVTACFKFVRDNISHSWDAKQNPVTLSASQVLEHGTGYCYAKSHLLAALLRANGIPTALCYQRLRLGPAYGSEAFCLHGLNAAWLEDHGWYRLDPRGDNEHVQTSCQPPVEQLAFVPQAGEMDIEGRFAEPLEVVVQALSTHTDIFALADALPDWQGEH